MDLTGQKIAVLVEEQYQELEVWYPYYRLKEANADVRLLGTGKKEYKSKVGYPCREDKSLVGEKGKDYAGVVVPGGFAPDFMRRHEDPARFVREVWQSGGVVAAICHGLWIPASAGILRGMTCTSFFAIKDDCVNAGATWIDCEVSVDDRLVSARKPDDLPAFMRETIKLLAKKKG